MPGSPRLNHEEAMTTTTTKRQDDQHVDHGPSGGRPRPPFHRWVDVLPCNSRADQHHQDDGSALKRVSLDATATWYGDEEDDEDDFMDDQPAAAHNDSHEEHPHNPVDMEDTMMMLDWAADDGDHMDTGVLSGLMILDEEYPSHHDHDHDHDGNALLDEIFLGEVASSPLRVECCWDQLGAAEAKDDDDEAHCPDPLSRGVLRKHSSSSTSSTASAGSSSVAGGAAASNDDNDSQLSLHELFEKRRAQLEASMERSRKSRKYLEKHIQQRASLASVLADIERSSRQIIVEVLSTSDAASSSATAEGHPGGDDDDEDEEADLAADLGLVKEEDEDSSMVTVEV